MTTIGPIGPVSTPSESKAVKKTTKAVGVAVKAKPEPKKLPLGRSKKEMIADSTTWPLPKTKRRVFQVLEKDSSFDLNDGNFSRILVTLIRDVYGIQESPSASVSWVMIRIRTWIDLNQKTWESNRTTRSKLISILRELDV